MKMFLLGGATAPRLGRHTRLGEGDTAANFHAGRWALLPSPANAAPMLGTSDVRMSSEGP